MYSFENNPYIKYLPAIQDESAWIKYTELIDSLKALPRDSDALYEDHHIIPRSYLSTAEEAKDVENLISIKARDHYIAHQLLWDVFQDSSMTAALWRMTTSRQNGNIEWISAEQYENLKKKFVEQRRDRAHFSRWMTLGDKHERVSLEDVDEHLQAGWSFGKGPLSEEEKQNLKLLRKKYWEEHPEEKAALRQKQRENNLGSKNPFFGKKHSEESLEKMRKANSVRTPARVASRKLVSEQLKGRVRINNGTEELSVKKENVEDYLASGWKLGRCSCNIPNKNKIIIHKNSFEKLILKEELDSYIENGWIKGRLPFSEEHRQKLSENRKGIPSWRKGRKFSEEQTASSRNARRAQSERYREAKQNGFSGTWNEFCHKERELKNERR